MNAIYPNLQKGLKDGLPYVFQGLYNDKVTAELISTYFGDIERQEESTHYASVFEPMREALKGGAGRVFDHSNRIAYYSECFVGRDQEIKTILDWVVKKDGKNIPEWINKFLEKGNSSFYSTIDGVDYYWCVIDKCYVPIPSSSKEIKYSRQVNKGKMIKHHWSASIIDLGALSPPIPSTAIQSR